MAEQTVTVRLRADVNAYKAALYDARRAGADMTVGTEQNLKRLGDIMSDVGGTLTRRVSLPLAALGAGAAFAAVSWESAWAGVTKTVDGTADQLAELEAGLRDMAKELPATHGEIAGVAEAAGQLGVAVDDVEQFTRVMIDLGETTNLTSDAAATALAQMMNIMQSAPEDVERLASTLVELGNNGASTEREILDMALRLAGAGQLIGASEGEVLALANAMASLGIQSQLGGGAMSRAILAMYTAVEEGSGKLNVFARVAGMTADQFARAFRTDPIAAIDEFIRGMGRTRESGGNLVEVLQAVELAGTQDAQVLLRLAGAGDLLTESLEMQERAWEENTALQAEAEKRYATTAAQLGMLRNNAVDLGITVGSQLLGPMVAVTQVLIDMLGGLQDLHPWLMTAAVGFGALIAAVGPLTSLGGMLIRNWGQLAAGARALASGLEAIRLRGMYATQALGPMGVAGAAGIAIGAIGVLTLAYQHHQAEAERARARTRAFEQAIRDVGDAADGTKEALDDMLRDGEGVPDVVVDALVAAGRTTGDLADAIHGTNEEWNSFVDDVKSAFSDQQPDNIASRLGLTNLDRHLSTLRGSALDAASNVETTNEAIGDTGDQAELALPPIEEFAGGMTLVEQTAEEAAKAQRELFKEMDAVIDLALGGTMALVEWEESLASLREGVADHGSSLDETTDAGRRNLRNLYDLVQAGKDRVQQMIEEGATADEVAYAQELMALQIEAVATELGLGSERATEFADSLRDLPEGVAIDVDLDISRAQAALNAINDALAGTNRSLGSLLHGDPAGSSGAGGGGLTRRGSGGPTVPGRSYIVGDRGAEVLTMTSAGGFVHPNGSAVTQAAMSASGSALSPGGGGGMNVQLVQQIDAAGLDVDALSEVTIRKMMWRMGLISRGAV